MKRVTNEILLERIDNIRVLIKDEIQPDVKANTRWRYITTGGLAAITTVVVWVISYIKGELK